MMKSVFSFALGFGAGWAVRSMADSSEGVGIKLMAVALKTKEHFDQWIAVEREHLEDMFAEARTKAGRVKGVGKFKSSTVISQIHEDHA
jgi:hypothetical protein